MVYPLGHYIIIVVNIIVENTKSWIHVLKTQFEWQINNFDQYDHLQIWNNNTVNKHTPKYWENKRPMAKWI